MNKKEITDQLVVYNNKLNRTPGRRDLPYSLYRNCCKYFGSLNNAKQAAELNIYKRKCEPLSEDSKKLTLELVKIVSYLTGDGHLHKDLKGFLHSSKDINSLKDFEFCVKKQFGINISKIQYSDEDSYGECIQYRYFNTTVAKFLYSIGTPKGDKVITSFDIPEWIKNNKEFMKEYIKILFYCEGSKFLDKTTNKNRIQINMRKTEDFVPDGQIFMNSIKNSLKKDFNIETSNLWLLKGQKRNKDNKNTKDLRFIITKEFNDSFIENIGWLK